MNALLDFARRQGFQAEIYWVTRDRISVQYRLSEPVAALEDKVDQCVVRVIRDGKLGAACGTLPSEELLKEAAEAARRGGAAEFRFAGPSPAPKLPSVDPDLAALSVHDFLLLGDKVAGAVLSARPDVPLMVGLERVLDTVRIATTEGLEREGKHSRASLSVGAPFREAGAGLWKTLVSRAPLSFPEDTVAEFMEWYGWGERVVRPPTGAFPVLLAPEAAFLLAMPLAAGLSGEALWQHTSPLEGKLGESILADSITIWDDPLRPDDPFVRAFDDEGTACRRRPLVKRGMLKGYLLDLRTAALLGQPPTGNGFKRALFGGGPWASPTPWPARILIEAGSVPWRELLGSLDRGLLVYGGMGFHSASYLQGNFSVQALGFYVEGGKVKGRLSGTMVSGNIYQDLRQSVVPSRERVELPGSVAPYLLVQALQVAGQG